MAVSPALIDQLAQVPSLRALSKELAEDPRSEKTAEVWRGQLQQWKRTGGITLENAQILADHLPGHPEPEDLVGQAHPDQGLGARLDAIESTLEAVVEGVQELRRLVVQTQRTPGAGGPRP